MLRGSNPESKTARSPVRCPISLLLRLCCRIFATRKKSKASRPLFNVKARPYDPHSTGMNHESTKAARHFSTFVRGAFLPRYQDGRGIGRLPSDRCATRPQWRDQHFCVRATDFSPPPPPAPFNAHIKQSEYLLDYWTNFASWRSYDDQSAAQSTIAVTD